MEIPPVVTAEPNYDEEVVNDQEPETMMKDENVDYAVQQDLPGIESIEYPPLEEDDVEQPRPEVSVYSKFYNKLFENPSIFLCLVLCLYSVVSLLSILSVPMYITEIRFVTIFVGVIGLRMKSRPYILAAFSGMFFQLTIINPPIAFYTISGVIFNDWEQVGIKVLVIFLLVLLFGTVTFLETVGVITTFIVLVSRYKKRKREREEKENKQGEDDEDDQQNEIENPIETFPLEDEGNESNDQPEHELELVEQENQQQHQQQQEEEEQQQEDGSGEMVLQSFGVQPISEEGTSY